MKIVYISWAPYCSRSDHTARELGGVSYMVYLKTLGSHPATIGLKYLGQMWQTWWILWRERPDVTFVMAPPVFAVAAVYVYAKLSGGAYVIDAHTAAFLHPRWQRFQGLQHGFGRRALTTIVTNEHLAERVRQGGGHASVIRDVPVIFNEKGSLEIPTTFTVAAVCSFNADEPIAEILRAAREHPHVSVYMTGDPDDLDPGLAREAPENVTITGFLSDADYGQLLRQADVVLTLTTRDHTMLRGAYEAIYQDTPVIISDWPLLREAFETSAIYVDNTAASIAAAIDHMQKHQEQYQAGARALHRKKLSEWERHKEELLARCAR